MKVTMMKVTVMAWIVVMGLGFLACEGEKGAPEGPDEQHASRDVVPGSHDDWCGEHQVPESQCTRCDRSLIAAFKATNDWCQEHGLPESQCTACNPELRIVRPPRPTGAR